MTMRWAYPYSWTHQAPHLAHMHETSVSFMQDRVASLMLHFLGCLVAIHLYSSRGERLAAADIEASQAFQVGGYSPLRRVCQPSAAM